MPHNNRMSTSNALKTSDIWSKTIGCVIPSVVVVLLLFCFFFATAAALFSGLTLAFAQMLYCIPHPLNWMLFFLVNFQS